MKMFANGKAKTRSKNFSLPDPGRGRMNAERADPATGPREKSPFGRVPKVPGNANVLNGPFRLLPGDAAGTDVMIDFREDRFRNGTSFPEPDPGGKSAVGTKPVALPVKDFPGGILAEMFPDLEMAGTVAEAAHGENASVPVPGAGTPELDMVQHLGQHFLGLFPAGTDLAATGTDPEAVFDVHLPERIPDKFLEEFAFSGEHHDGRLLRFHSLYLYYIINV